MKLNHLTIELVELGGEMRAQVAVLAAGHIDHIAMDVKDVYKSDWSDAFSVENALEYFIGVIERRRAG